MHYGNDGSVAVMVDGRRIERYVGGRLTDALDLAERFQGRLPALSPDNCSAVFRAGDRVRTLDVGCSPLARSRLTVPGHAATWSPNGEWLAVGGATTVTFYNLVADEDPISWPVGAVRIIWRRS